MDIFTKLVFESIYFLFRNGWIESDSVRRAATIWMEVFNKPKQKAIDFV